MRFGLAALILLVLVASPLPTQATQAIRCFPIEDFFSVSHGPALVGDVDGDRRPDRVRTRARWTDDQRCRAWLIVKTDDRTYRLQIDPTPGLLVAPPPLAALVRLQHRHGLAIALIPWKGASTKFVDLFAIHHRRLIRLNSSLLGYAGSVVNRAGVDCAARRGAVMVASEAEFRIGDNRYHVTRVFFGLRAGLLTPLPRLTERARVRFAELGRFPELNQYVPFPSCTVAAGIS
jgi:hypothetical protein